MAIEQSWVTVPPRAFTANGTALGEVNVADTAGFKVKQTVVIQSSTVNPIQVQVKRIASRTQLIVGPIPENIQPAFKQQGSSLLSVRQDISAYVVADGAFIYAVEQQKNKIKPDDIIQAIYRQEPGTTIGVEIDDQYGNPIDSIVDSSGVNRLAVDGQFHADVDVQVDVDIDGVWEPSNPDPDNIGLIGNTRSATPGPTNQIQRLTSKPGTANTDTISLDVSIHDHLGNEFTPSNQFPVFGPLTNTELRAAPVPISAASLPLPNGASTEAKQDIGNTSLDSMDIKTPVLIAGRVPVDGSGVIQPVSGPLTDAELRASHVPVLGPLTDTELRASAVPISAASLPLPSNAATETTLSSLDSKVTAVNTGAVVVTSSALPSGAATETKQDVGNSSLASIDTKLVQLTLSGDRLKVDIPASGGLTDAELRASPVPVDGSGVTQPVSGPLTDSELRASPVPVLGPLTNTELRASPIEVFVDKSTSSSVTSVSGSASSVQLLAANANRRHVSIFNDSNADLYIKLGTTASITSFTVKVIKDGFYEIPILYTGRIDGIWTSANGAARITELT